MVQLLTSGIRVSVEVFLKEPTLRITSLTIPMLTKLPFTMREKKPFNSNRDIGKLSTLSVQRQLLMGKGLWVKNLWYHLEKVIPIDRAVW